MNERQNVLAAKDPDRDEPYSIDFRADLIADIERETVYATGQYVRPRQFQGFYLECTTAGETSSRNQPAPRAAGQVITDGSVIFTARHPDDISIGAIDTVTWDLQDGLTEVSSSIDGTVAHITVSGGIDGRDYRATATMTPVTGDAVDQTIYIPVRSQ